MESAMEHSAEGKGTAMQMCPACLTLVRGARVNKSGIDYAQCACGTIFTTQDISSALVTENDNSLARNKREFNQARVARVEQVLGYKPFHVIDFGCGEGHLVHYLHSQEIAAIGIDKHTEQKLGGLIPNTLDCIFMVEVIEHLPNPRETLAELVSKLHVNGVIYIETTWADQITDPVTSPYVDPQIGHVTILSLAGLLKCLPSNATVDYKRGNVVVVRRIS